MASRSRLLNGFTSTGICFDWLVPQTNVFMRSVLILAPRTPSSARHASSHTTRASHMFSAWASDCVAGHRHSAVHAQIIPVVVAFASVTFDCPRSHGPCIVTLSCAKHVRQPARRRSGHAAGPAHPMPAGVLLVAR